MNPESIFNHPVETGQAFGLDLSSEFFVCEIPVFTMSMSLHEFEALSRIRFMTQDMCLFFGVSSQEEVPNQAAIRWLNSVCSPDCVRDAATTTLLPHELRRWTHQKIFEREGSFYECLVQGYILPSLKVMFVEIAARKPIPIEEKVTFTADPFSWSDFDIGVLDNLEELDNFDEYEGLF